jgi:hypothetical protein
MVRFLALARNVRFPPRQSPLSTLSGHQEKRPNLLDLSAAINPTR